MCAMKDKWVWLAVLAMLFTNVAPGAAQGWIEPGVNRGGFAVDKVRSEVVTDKVVGGVQPGNQGHCRH